MKLVSFAAAGRNSYGAVVGDGIVDLGRRLGDRRQHAWAAGERGEGCRVAGDVIATGTPEEVGFARKPPLWMKPGDVVEVEIDGGIGTLRNPILAEGCGA